MGFFILPWFSLPKNFDPEIDDVRTIFDEIREQNLTGARLGGFVPPKPKDKTSNDVFSISKAFLILLSPCFMVVVCIYVFGHLLNFYGAGNVEHLAYMHVSLISPRSCKLLPFGCKP